MSLVLRETSQQAVHIYLTSRLRLGRTVDLATRRRVSLEKSLLVVCQTPPQLPCMLAPSWQRCARELGSNMVHLRCG
jgi:hypothetical protein